MAIIAANNIRPLMIPTVSLDLSLQGARHFMKLRHEAGLGVCDTKLALWVYCAATEAEAEAGSRRYMNEYADSALRHYEMTGTHFDGLRGYEGYAERAAALRADPSPFLNGFYDRHPWGTPEMVLDKIAALAEQFGTSEIMCVFRYGGMSHDEAARSMRLFAERVLPGVQMLSPAPMQLTASHAEA
jgi:alkanesulfonate monooxygenase SsuD/methylene tetrahydromethanopterin reductase-like flavin-dependent oxidoreductase (luciferase family)